jgi:hypothetical protein
MESESPEWTSPRMRATSWREHAKVCFTLFDLLRTRAWYNSLTSGHLATPMVCNTAGKLKAQFRLIATEQKIFTIDYWSA